ncbi:MAG: cation diffusion facilitator family transporter [Bryocella sp.]
MPTSANTSVLQQRSAAKRAAALTSLLAAAAISLLQLITGILTGSLGMLSEALHSGIDLIAAGITLLAVRVSDRPPDADHSYGHGKLESLAAGIEVIIMLGSCFFIARAAIQRMMHNTHLDLSWSIWPFLVLLLSMAVDFTRSRNLHRVAQAQRSDALEADAVHFGTDLYSSAAVFLGLLATYLGQRLHIPALEYADPIAALLVSAIILYITWKLAHSVLDSLLDATPAELTEQLHRDLLSVEGISAVQRIRTRRSGSDTFVDLTLDIPRKLTFQRAEQINAAATAAVQTRIPSADVVIHAVPTAPVNETIFDRVRAIAARSNLTTHDISVQQSDGKLHVEQHLEVPEDMTLQQAHDIASQLEADIHADIPEVSTVLTHIESEAATISQTAQFAANKNLVAQLRRAAEHFPEIADIHEFTVIRGHGGTANTVKINCHVSLPEDLTMSNVHDIITAFESEFRHDHPQVSRVLIHPEPINDNAR